MALAVPWRPPAAHAAGRALSNLDVDLRERLAHEVRGILKAAGATALFVTHDQFEAFAIGDVIGVMHEGHLHQWDDAYTLYHRPGRPLRGRFIGHGVFAPATLVQRGTNVVAQTPWGDLTDLAESTAQQLPRRRMRCAAARRRHRARRPRTGAGADRAQGVSRVRISVHPAAAQRSQVMVMAHVPSHHDHAVGEWIGIRAQVDHVVTFARGA